MKIYDCFLFNDENKILEIRLNILNQYVDHFVIIESKFNHQGKFKGQKIDQKIIKQFRNKIKYIYYEEIDDKKTSWELENYQRNLINLGLKNCTPEDIVIVSDLDEIPNLEHIKFNKIQNQIIAFKQLNSMYKLNLIRDNSWLGTKMCRFKTLRSPQWLRDIKVHKKYPNYRIDKIFFSKKYYHNFKIIEKGGWHFGWIRNETEITEKLNSFAHIELNKLEFNKLYINNCIKNNINFLDKKKLEKIDLTLMPFYIQDNIEKYKDILFL